ncbi:mitochondrial import protein Pam17-domain-containing protein [Russula earlei]|uniref:Mitochondrial import protein Pam17-domain-containing protein n=1 Tax=Russula earlei TaxID=71964 RepID=A0ACC0UAG6_9AGAM|nr:mitochondrial import protein Pam17-domain-containing protein [Russula earlei]
MATPYPRLPLALRCASRRSVLSISPPRNVVFSIRFQVDRCIAGGEGFTAVVRVSRRSAREAEMGTGWAGGAAYFGSMELDATKPIMVQTFSLHFHAASFIFPQGIDPILFFAGATLSCMGAGYLVGPIIGSTLWRVTHRRTMALIEARDHEFHQHIVRNRVDPRAQSAANPCSRFLR